MTTEQRIAKILAIFLATAICIAIVTSIVGGINFLISIFTTDHSSTNPSREVLSLTDEEIDDITSLDIELRSINLNIQKGSKFEVKVTNPKRYVQTRITGSTLKIKERRVFPWSTSRGEVTITVPEEKILNKLLIEQGAGKIDIASLYSKYLKIGQGTGNLTISDSTFDNVKIDGGVGKMSIENSSLEDLDLDSGVGAVEIDGLLTGNCKIDGGVGTIDINLSDYKEEYTLKIDNGIGTILVDGQRVSGRIGDGENVIDIDGGIGSIKINFKEKQVRY